ncbi:MAG: Vmh family MBL fold metallo-hydrolase, partial [Acinetobacter sp.]
SAVFAGQLSFKNYNPQAQGIFPVSSTLITGEHDAVLVDAQFSTKDADQLVKLIQDSGKNLKYIVITAGDPDFYFGLEPLVKAFPQAKIVASTKVVDHIEQTKTAKLAYWGPILKDGAPQQLYVPTAITETTLTLEGEKIEIKTPNTYASYLWVPSQRTILGGVGVSSGIHLWTADTQTAKERKQWIKDLNGMKKLHPVAVIPAHYIGAIPKGTDAIDFTAQYLKDFEKTLKSSQGSQAVISKMKTLYPNLQGLDSLELSSKVHTGEMKWQ